jgi:hypothetical protein
MSAPCPRRLTPQEDARGIAAERRCILFDPRERGKLIEQTIVPGRLVRILGSERAGREITERSEAVVDCDSDNLAVLRERGAVIEIDASGSRDPVAPMDENHDRELWPLALRKRRPNI